MVGRTNMHIARQPSFSNTFSWKMALIFFKFIFISYHCYILRSWATWKFFNIDVIFWNKNIRFGITSTPFMSKFLVPLQPSFKCHASKMSSVLQRLLHNLSLHSLLPSHWDSMAVGVGSGWCMTVLFLQHQNCLGKHWLIFELICIW